MIFPVRGVMRGITPPFFETPPRPYPSARPFSSSAGNQRLAFAVHIRCEIHFSSTAELSNGAFR